MSTGWICPKCSAGVAPSERTCPNCSPAFASNPWPAQPWLPAPHPGLPPLRPMWDPFGGGVYGERCAFDGLPPGVYGLVCFCSKCTPRMALCQNAVPPSLCFSAEIAQPMYFSTAGDWAEVKPGTTASVSS